MTFICPNTDMEGGGVMTLPINPITASDVVNAVCAVWGVTKAGLFSGSRLRKFAYARFCAFNICRQITDLSYPQIANVFGRDHTTVMSGAHRANDLLGVDAEFSDKYDKTLECIAAFQDGQDYSPWYEKKPPVEKIIKIRTCLKCREDFKSDIKRICPACTLSNSRLTGGLDI